MKTLAGLRDGLLASLWRKDAAAGEKEVDLLKQAYLGQP